MYGTKMLTERQNQVFEFLVEYQQDNGMPPTIREICGALSFKSVNNARQHLRLIEQKGYLRLLKGKARGIELCVGKPINKDENGNSVPLVGDVAAGVPIMAEENIETHITLDRDLFTGNNLFTLRIQGDSMEGIGVLNNDFVIVRQQNTANSNDIVVAIIDGDATLKRYHRTKDSVILHAENPKYEDIIIPNDRNVWIVGIMVGIIRKC